MHFPKQSKWLYHHSLETHYCVLQTAMALQKTADLCGKFIGLVHRRNIFWMLPHGVTFFDGGNACAQHFLMGLCLLKKHLSGCIWGSAEQCLLLQLCVAFSGYLISHTPVYFRWLSKSGYLTFAYSALYQNEFDGLQLNLKATNPASPNGAAGTKSTDFSDLTSRGACLSSSAFVCLHHFAILAQIVSWFLQQVLSAKQIWCCAGLALDIANAGYLCLPTGEHSTSRGPNGNNFTIGINIVILVSIFIGLRLSAIVLLSAVYKLKRL